MITVPSIRNRRQENTADHHLDRKVNKEIVNDDDEDPHDGGEDVNDEQLEIDHGRPQCQEIG